MKNRGFTLIELLVVIVVMGALGTIITVSFTGSLQKAKQKECDEFVRKIEDGACVYAGLSSNKAACNRDNCDPIKISELINQGLVEIEIDACTGENLDLNQTVTVTWDQNGEKTCEYNGVKEYER